VHMVPSHEVIARVTTHSRDMLQIKMVCVMQSAAPPVS